MATSKYEKQSVTTLSYAYGPGYVNNRDGRGNIVNVDNMIIGKIMYNSAFVFSLGQHPQFLIGNFLLLFLNFPALFHFYIS